jgi:hypothetical protein
MRFAFMFRFARILFWDNTEESDAVCDTAEENRSEMITA